MDSNWKKKFLVGGMAATLTLSGLTGCADGEDQDNNVEDEQQEDQVKETEDGTTNEETE
ncbi:hypothetical protein [Domibacillus mangrovi]|uniref:hypothetical protein n=1 Tax=Domibacillus mangrovi TaxID=1714354 RepID=UPI000A75B5F6|nr:hypothetical protein [Domibacillus mangrovi]